MRLGPRVCIVSLVLFAGLCSQALAASSLTVFADNAQIALGGVTTLAAHAEADAGFGGGHVAFKYKPADADCQATPEADEGVDVPPAAPVGPGAGVSDVGGQTVQLDAGNWRVCGWLVDDAAGTVVAQGSTVVQVIPFSGSLSISVRPIGKTYQVTLTYSTSSPGRLHAWLQPAARQCPRNPARVPKRAVMLVPRGGRFVGSDGGLGRAVPARRLTPGRWRVCTWLIADAGRVGPASRTFEVPRRARRAVRVAG